MAISAVAVSAIVVRFWKLGWGLEDGMPFPDERLIWEFMLGAFTPLRSSSFMSTPTGFLYPTLYGYVAGVAVGVGNALGLIGPAASEDMSVYLVARAVAATAGLGTVAAVGVLAWRFYSARAGLLAAALMAVVPLDAWQAHYACTDTLLTALCALGLLGSIALARVGTVRLAVITGGIAGLGFSTKYTGLFLLVASGWAVIEIAHRQRSLRPLLLIGGAVAVGFGVGVLLGCPPCLVQSKKLLSSLEHLKRFSTGVFPNNSLVPTLGWYGRPYLYQLVASLPYVLGWPLYLAALLGVAAALRRRDLPDRIVLVSLLSYFLVIGHSRVTFPRYLLPLVPHLVLLTARFLCQLPSKRSVRDVLFIAVWLYCLCLTLSQVARFSYDQQKGLAQWIRTALPPGESSVPRVAVAGGRPLRKYLALEQPLSKVGLVYRSAPAGHWFDEEPEVFVLSEWLAISIRRDYPNGVMARDLDRLEAGRTAYREAARWHSGYLQDDFYIWLDPAFAQGGTLGEIGFRVYVRSGRLANDGVALPGR